MRVLVRAVPRRPPTVAEDAASRARQIFASHRPIKHLGLRPLQGQATLVLACHRDLDRSPAGVSIPTYTPTYLFRVKHNYYFITGCPDIILFSTLPASPAVMVLFPYQFIGFRKSTCAARSSKEIGYKERP